MLLRFHVGAQTGRSQTWRRKRKSLGLCKKKITAQLAKMSPGTYVYKQVVAGNIVRVTGWKGTGDGHACTYPSAAPLGRNPEGTSSTWCGTPLLDECTQLKKWWLRYCDISKTPWSQGDTSSLRSYLISRWGYTAICFWQVTITA